MPEPTRHPWVPVLLVLAVFVVLPLWVSYRVLRWILRLAFWSGVAA